ncbi:MULTISPECIES: hypothetical protein [unclassified Caballeronia]|uniref:hypothetical protein n=1 Tax=unclassified Caballeronia TaxID=2646786 RepID=UPI002866AC68|nr:MULTISPECIES: hypothetical protein [unclassified Caballeronia]MDR5751089.1 hypothetical protein [Caballeronia sp. LZ024]MDR5844774.1 hypothetical protein [Caballeronia sp. LZ031]
MNQKTNALNTETTNATVVAVTADLTGHATPDEAYDEGAFFADTDWQWALKEDEDARPSSMAEHRATAWAFISGTVCPDWSDEEARSAFYVGYEDRATELADAGEAGYEALAGYRQAACPVYRQSSWPVGRDD